MTPSSSDDPERGARAATLLHLDQVLAAVRDLPKWLHWTRHEGVPDRYRVAVNSLRITDTEIAPGGTPHVVEMDHVPFERLENGNWVFDGPVVVIEKELRLEQVPADECVRQRVREWLGRMVHDTIAFVEATAGEPNEFRNIVMQLRLELLGPRTGHVLARARARDPIIEYPANVDCVAADNVVFDEPQTSLIARGGVLYAAGDTERYEHQERRTLADCKPGDTVFAKFGGDGEWHPLRIVFGAPNAPTQ